MNPSAQDASSMSQAEINKKLFSNAMKSNWDEVIKIYKNHPQAHEAKITRSGDTAIHIAISDGQELVAEELVTIASSRQSDTLAIANELGNTPLHLAAYVGNVKMCSCIAGRDRKLISLRNKNSETPFFIAVAHGRKHAFLRLHSFCLNGEGYEYCRRNDGETILHSAISGEYFGEPTSAALCLSSLSCDSIKENSKTVKMNKIFTLIFVLLISNSLIQHSLSL